MTVRKCGTCKHYEPSPIWRKGWCRNPRLYSPQQSHLVGQDDLDCSRGLGNFWEQADPPEKPAEDAAVPIEPTEAAANGRHPLRFFATPPRLATAVAGMMASSTSGPQPPGGSERGAGATPAGRGRAPAGGGRPNYPGPSRPEGPRRPPEEERGVSYQPEERYWTDYLRIALPVVGLLLMLGLFWFWAASLIRNGDSGKSPTPAGQAKAAVTTVAAAHPTPTSTPVVQITPTHQTSAVVTVPAQPATQPTQATQKQPTSTAAASTGNSTNSGTAAASGGSQQFNAGDVVNVTQDGVNMRDQPTTSGSQVVETLSQGTQLTILSGPTRADGYAWYQVEDVNQQKGYVAGQFLSK